MSFSISPAKAEHAGGFADVMVRSWHAAYTGIIPQDYLDENVTVEKYLPRVQGILSGSPHSNNVALLDGKVIGVFTISKLRDAGASAEDGEIIAIYLLPEYFGKGYGKRMIEYAQTKLLDMGYKNIYIWVLKENLRARRFYEKCGFSLDGTEKEITIGKPLAELRYKKELTALKTF